MLDITVHHWLHSVLPAVADYEAAEAALSEAFGEDKQQPHWEPQAYTAKRRAAELAIAIDGLADRAALDLNRSKKAIRTAVSAECNWPDGTARTGCLDRVRAVAVAYRHKVVDDPTLPISSEQDILVVGLGYGLDGYGVGKFGGVEVLVREKNGTSWKFMGDAPIALAGWLRFFAAEGVTPPAPPTVCGIELPINRIP